MFREEGRPQPGDCGHLARVWNALRPCLSGRRSPCAGKLADPAARHLSGYKGPTSYLQHLESITTDCAVEAGTGKAKGGRVKGVLRRSKRVKQS